MSLSPERMAGLKEARLEIGLWIAASVGAVGLVQQILFTAHPDGLKLAACGLALAGAPAAFRNLLGGKGGE